MFLKIKDVNFESGIRAKDIDWNFEFLDHKLNNTRLHTAGMGIVYGFALEDLGGFRVKVRPGICINAQGEEMEIREDTILKIEAPDHVAITEKKMVTSDGSIVLGHMPYNHEKFGYVDADYVKKHKSCIKITDYDNVLSKVGIVNLYQNIVFVDAVKWANSYVTVQYEYAYSRIDTVVINAEGKIKIYKGIMSASPSKTNLADCQEEVYVIGFVEVVVDFANHLIYWEPHTRDFSRELGDLTSQHI